MNIFEGKDGKLCDEKGNMYVRYNEFQPNTMVNISKLGSLIKCSGADYAKKLKIIREKMEEPDEHTIISALYDVSSESVIRLRDMCNKVLEEKEAK